MSRARIQQSLTDAGKNEAVANSLMAQERARRIRREEYDKYKTTKDSKLITELQGREETDRAGVVNLLVADENGKHMDKQDRVINIAGTEHQVKGGKVRIVSKSLADNQLEELIAKQRNNTRIISACLTDRSNKVCEYLLGNQSFKALQSGVGDEELRAIGLSPSEITAVRGVDGTPRYILSHHSRSKEFGESLHKLSLIVENTSIIMDDSIDGWDNLHTQKLGSGSSNVGGLSLMGGGFGTRPAQGGQPSQVSGVAVGDA